MFILIIFVSSGLAEAQPADDTSGNRNCSIYDGTEAVVERALTHVIVLGEMHGTNESVDAFEHLICVMLDRGMPVRVGLEATWSQGASLDSQLRLPLDMDAVREAAPDMWSTHDGRSTEAILELLNKIAAWKSNGHAVLVFAFDAETRDWVTAENRSVARDAAMAIQVDKNLADFDGAVVLLTGDFHARKHAFDQFGQHFVPMASKIKERPVFSLRMRYGPGEAWVNVSVEHEDGTVEESIGPFQMSGNVGDNSASRVFEITETEHDYFDGYYFTGPITASAPAFSDSAIKQLEFPTEIDGDLDKGWEFYVMRFDTCVAQKKRHCEVFERAKKDTYIAQLLADVRLEQTTIDEMTGLTQSEFDAAMKWQSEDNDRWLEDRINRAGWFNISDYGADADKAAFFIVQHSSNIEFQKRIAALLEPLATSGETSKSSFALLSDRVAIKEGRRQKYGSQGECSEDNGWRPFPVAKGDVDARRAQMGLESMAGYSSRMSAFCPT
ncbi:MAG: DUF6624 domain-containing protein [Pseudomonadota bacterium]|nr:DUF6624 domain-containing protein [Pseudomonadota bacterium]